MANEGSTRSDEHEEKDGISKFFANLFGNDKDEPRRYSNAARSSDAIVTVHARSQQEASAAARLLDDAGAEDVDALAGRQDHQRQFDTPQGSGSEERENDRTIPVVEEDVHIGKREVETGGVRVRSRIVERPVEQNLRLREEHVRVERRKVDRPVEDRDRQHFKEGTTEFIEHKEVPVVSKNARVVEEIHMSKQVSERQEKVRDTEKKSQVDVEKLHRGQGSDPTNRDNPTNRDTKPGDTPAGRKKGPGLDPSRR
jgi:stress response protein YsnF